MEEAWNTVPDWSGHPKREILMQRAPAAQQAQQQGERIRFPSDLCFGWMFLINLVLVPHQLALQVRGRKTQAHARALLQPPAPTLTTDRVSTPSYLLCSGQIRHIVHSCHKCHNPHMLVRFLASLNFGSKAFPLCISLHAAVALRIVSVRAS